MDGWFQYISSNFVVGGGNRAFSNQQNEASTKHTSSCTRCCLNKGHLPSTHGITSPHVDSVLLTRDQPVYICTRCYRLLYAWNLLLELANVKAFHYKECTCIIYMYEVLSSKILFKWINWKLSFICDHLIFARFVKHRPWGIKGENVNILPSLSPATKSFTPFIGVYIARLLINRGPYRWGLCPNTRFLMAGFKDVKEI